METENTAIGILQKHSWPISTTSPLCVYQPSALLLRRYFYFSIRRKEPLVTTPLLAFLSLSPISPQPFRSLHPPFWDLSWFIPSERFLDVHLICRDSSKFLKWKIDTINSIFSSLLRKILHIRYLRKKCLSGNWEEIDINKIFSRKIHNQLHFFYLKKIGSLIVFFKILHLSL